ncbi:hypothetical protein FACS189447_07690 [Spirochaetia bacterium]|nr:hypothetical protein FACS189447_07690 [Spirochaetia bacterium]
MKDCFICKRIKTITVDGLFCNLLGAKCDDVEFCKLFTNSFTSETKRGLSMNSTVENDVIEKIQKLFSLGQSPNQYEAEMAIKKAEALMEKYDLSFGQVNYLTEYLKVNKSHCPEWQLKIFNAICLANNCSPAYGAGRGMFSLAGRKINVFLSMEMFNYLSETIKRISKEKCKNKGHKYNHDFKMAMAITLSERLEEYGARVSWAVDRQEELKNIDEYRELKTAKNRIYTFQQVAAIEAGMKAGETVSLNKQTGLNKTEFIGASV